MRHFLIWDAALAGPLPPASCCSCQLWSRSLQTEELHQPFAALTCSTMAQWLHCLLWKCPDSQEVALQQFYFLWSPSCCDWKKLNIINLIKCLLHNGSFVRCFIVLHHGQMKLWKYHYILTLGILSFSMICERNEKVESCQA